MPEYLKRLEAEITTLKHAVNQSDFDTLNMIGHKLSGHAGSYGLHGLGKLGAKLENFAKQKNLKSAKEVVHDITQYLDRLMIEYE